MDGTGPSCLPGILQQQQLGFRPLANGVCRDLKGAFGLACLGLEAAAPAPALLLAAELAGAVRVHRQVLLVCNVGASGSGKRDRSRSRERQQLTESVDVVVVHPEDRVEGALEAASLILG